MKKRIWIYPIICLIFGGCLWAYFSRSTPKPQFDLSDLWVSSRPLPEKIAIDAYLSGNSARGVQDLLRAVQSYKRVLEQDPENVKVLDDAYMLAAIQCVLGEITPYLDKLTSSNMLSDYAKVVGAVQQNNLDKAVGLLTKKSPHNVDSFLMPLIKTWIYAQKGSKENALKEVGLLKEDPFIVGYQKVLLGTYFKDNELIQRGINQIGDNDIPAIGYFPLLKKEIAKSGNWERSALYKKYTELMASYPVTADLLFQIGQTELTANQGLAEVLYLTSALGGKGKLSREEALALNSMALLLDPQKQISLVWGAELAEGLHLPQVALFYYQRLKYHSATLTFRKTSDLILLGRTSEALPQLEELEKTNKTSVPLLTLLGQVYQEQKQNEKALAIYDRLISLLEKNSQNKPLVMAYVNRGILHGPKESEKMLEDLSKAHILDPENAMLLNDLGYHQLEMGLVEEGFDLVQKAHQKKPNDPYILDSLAFGYWKKGQSDKALPLAERALDLMPQSALINAHLGDIYASLGRRREASFQYKKALDLGTDLSDSLTQELNQKLKGEEQ